MKHTILILVFVALTAAAFAKDAKQYDVGTVHPFHYTTTTTTTTCRGDLASINCDSGDVDSAHVLFSVTLADGSVRDILVHVPFSPNPLKGVQADTQVRYRIWHHAGNDYLVVLDSNGKEGKYGLTRLSKQPKGSAYGPAPVSE